MKNKLLAGLTTGVLIFGGVAQAENEAIYNAATGSLNIPKVSVGSESYNVDMQQQGQGLDFGVINATPSTSSSSSNIATYNPAVGSLNIPTVVVGADSYTVVMQQQGQSLNFTVTGASVAQTSSTSLAGQAVVDLGSYGKLIAPVQVNNHWYYYWDRSGDGTSADTGSLNGGVDYLTHDTLDTIFTQDINGNQNPGTNTTDTFRYATLNGVRVALPTDGSGTAIANSSIHMADNGNYTDLVEIWDSCNSGFYTSGVPSGWISDAYWSATLSGSYHVIVDLRGGAVGANNAWVGSPEVDNEDYGRYVALEVL